MTAKTSQSENKPRKALQLNIRVSQTEREFLAKAAKGRNLSVSEFVLRACQDAMKAASATAAGATVGVAARDSQVVA